MSVRVMHGFDQGLIEIHLKLADYPDDARSSVISRDDARELRDQLDEVLGDREEGYGLSVPGDDPHVIACRKDVAEWLSSMMTKTGTPVRPDSHVVSRKVGPWQ